jgi:muramidase (phage lysozyme)
MARTAKGVPAFAASLLDFIGDIEAPHGYDTVYGNNQKKLKKPVTQMTIAEVIAAQAGWTKQFGSSAAGRYQFMRSTLSGLVAEQSLDTSAKFDERMQDQLGFVLLCRRGYGKFVAGKLGVTAFAKALAQEWASLPVLATTKGAKRQVTRGQSYYAGDGLNRSLVSPERVEAILRTKLPGTGEVTVKLAPSVETAPVPVDVHPRPSILSTLWHIIRGKDAKVETTTAEALPAVNQFRQVQELLASKGYVEVGQPDGLDGPRTRGAVRVFRAENGLPIGDAIDSKLIAALAAAGPRRISKSRVETEADDLREKGNTQIQTLDGVGWLGKALGLGGILGGIEKSGMLDKATDTLQTAQDTLGTVATVFTTIIGIAQWCFAHWWMFAIGGGLYLVFKVASGILNMVVLFRQGILARADK